MLAHLLTAYGLPSPLRGGVLPSPLRGGVLPSPLREVSLRLRLRRGSVLTHPPALGAWTYGSAGGDGEEIHPLARIQPMLTHPGGLTLGVHPSYCADWILWCASIESGCTLPELKYLPFVWGGGKPKLLAYHRAEGTHLPRSYLRRRTASPSYGGYTNPMGGAPT